VVRAHIETVLHKKVARRLREIRNDTIWIGGEDVGMAFKPLKMGLRVAHLSDNWDSFENRYQRVRHTYEELFKIQVTNEEVNADLEQLKFLQSRLKKHKMIQDTVVLLNQKINEGKRILVEDCSSSLMDVDFGVYPYTDSFNTTTGAVCTGLGVPEEAIETTIGVMSVTSLIKRAFLNHVKTFPSKVNPDTEAIAHESLKKALSTKYEVNLDEYDFGWLDLNPIRHAHMINKLSSIYLTNLDALDELDDIKICKRYKISGGTKDDGTPIPDTEVEGIHPTIINDFERLSPVFKEMKGWKKDITEIEDFDALPENCKTMIKEIEKYIKVQVKYISVNSEEDDGLLRIIR
jgi:adenylosuccinate synthase